MERRRAAAERVFGGEISEATMGDFQRHVLLAYVWIWASAILPILAEAMGRMMESTKKSGGSSHPDTYAGCRRRD
jgi:hypothetical protein